MSIVVKRITGQTLRQFAQERIFGPLGMTSTHYHDDPTMIVPRGQEYLEKQESLQLEC
jgi:CubicO group peptidase (beta-lactamase class C family)